MAIKFEKISAGMTLYDRHKYTMGHATMKTIREWKVLVISVDSDALTAQCSWNGNRAETWDNRRLEKLSVWSMYDKDIATFYQNCIGGISRVRLLTKAERADRDAATKP